ncbi:MAG TPA: MFS transporter [Candidatus Limnocylindrales bacterium]|nr:MFS transporter [Candidatus Limnocylindrales bacterium]
MAVLERVNVDRRRAFWLVAATLGLFLFAAAAPSPLYSVYAARWRFSAVTLTEVFAVYALALLVALLLTGSLSDSIGRRPVILVALAIQLASMAIFVFAGDTAWLFAGRIAQGVATGIATSALAASFVDLQPPENPTLASLVNSATPIVGLGLGAMASAVLVQYAPYPLQLVYVLMFAGFVAAGAGILAIAEPGRQGAQLSLKPRVGVERSLRPQFIAAVPSLVAGWAVGGFYMSLGPSLALQIAGSTNRLLGGLSIFILGGVGAAAIVAVRAWPPRRAMTYGGVALVCGLCIAVVAVVIKSPVLFFASNVITGLGFGVGWLGVLRTLIGLASPTSRGALIAAIFIVAYLAFAIPAVIAGYAVTRIGLHDAALWYGIGVGLLALAGLAGTFAVGRRPVAP